MLKPPVTTPDLSRPATLDQYLQELADWLERVEERLEEIAQEHTHGTPQNPPSV